MSKADIMNAGSNRLKEYYSTTVAPRLQETLGFKNRLEVPKVSKIVVNVGVKEGAGDSKVLQSIARVLEAITGQVPVKRMARKSIAGFKLREGMHIGVSVTLRRASMYAFLDKLVNLALPKVRDFQGVPTKFDGRGSYNLGIKEWNIFPEAESAGAGERMLGLNVTICTTSQSDEHAQALLKELGMPFRRTTSK
jgi:large subunit ribosomal protein L5